MNRTVSRPPVAPRRPRQRGFALIEALVAAAVVAVMTGLFLDTVITDTDVTVSLRERREAAMIAQSALAEAASPVAAAMPDTVGRSADLAWTIARSPYDGADRAGAPGLERIRVVVTSLRSGRQVLTLQTLRLTR